MTMIHERVSATRVYDASLMTEIKSKVEMQADATEAAEMIH